MYIAAGRGADNPRGQNVDVNRKLLSLRSFAASFKYISMKCDFIHAFHDFIHVYSPGAGADNPLLTKFDVNRNILPLRSFVAIFYVRFYNRLEGLSLPRN